MLSILSHPFNLPAAAGSPYYLSRWKLLLWLPGLRAALLRVPTCLSFPCSTSSASFPLPGLAVVMSPKVLSSLSLLSPPLSSLGVSVVCMMSAHTLMMNVDHRTYCISEAPGSTGRLLKYCVAQSKLTPFLPCCPDCSLPLEFSVLLSSSPFF